ncbi:hypothetical protein KVT40_000793 [Elsinoe batatas]|uniref:Uncharacterized protein n=1 Tax=Elsinoe batatas TaxID=2601811 RepID=A0A8K0LBM2_9PEZI|nr:hypothetical protein KVT40_000793 [Elsinoe batatas]
MSQELHANRSGPWMPEFARIHEAVASRPATLPLCSFRRRDIFGTLHKMEPITLTSSQFEAAAEMTSYFSEILGQVSNDVNTGFALASDRPYFDLILKAHGGDPRAAASSDMMKKLNMFIVLYYDRIKRRSTDGSM